MIKFKYIGLTIYSLLILSLTTIMTPMVKGYRFLCDCGLEVEKERAIVMKDLGYPLNKDQERLIK